MFKCSLSWRSYRLHVHQLDWYDHRRFLSFLQLFSFTPCRTFFTALIYKLSTEIIFSLRKKNKTTLRWKLLSWAVCNCVFKLQKLWWNDMRIIDVLLKGKYCVQLLMCMCLQRKQKNSSVQLTLIWTWCDETDRRLTSCEWDQLIAKAVWWENANEHLKIWPVTTYMLLYKYSILPDAFRFEPLVMFAEISDAVRSKTIAKQIL